MCVCTHTCVGSVSACVWRLGKMTWASCMSSRSPRRAATKPFSLANPATHTHTHNEHSHTHSHTPCLMVCECVNAENLYKLSFPSHSSRHPSTGPCVSSVLGPARRLQLYCLNTHTHTSFYRMYRDAKTFNPTRQGRIECVLCSVWAECQEEFTGMSTGQCLWMQQQLLGINSQYPGEININKRN